MENSGYSGRVKDIRHHFKMNQAEFAAFTSTLPSAISEFESGNREPSKEFIKTLSEIGISVDWLLSGTGTMLKPKNRLNDEKILHEKADISASPLPDESVSNTIESIEKPQKEVLVVVDGGVEQGVLIPVISQGISAGSGFDYEEGEIIRYIKVPAWLSRDGHNLIAVPVYGESMEPTLSRGNLAICDLGGFKDDGVYVLRDGERGLMFCKRLIWTPGGWTIVSDNPRYEPMKVEDKSIEVIARVIGAVKEVK